jgi:hypothetical protein
MQASKLLPIGALALAFAIGPAEAAPAHPTTSPLGKAEANAVTQVQWGYGYRRHRRGWGPGPWLGLGAGVVIGTIIANRPATAAIRAPSARRISGPSSGARASIRRIRAKGGSAPTSSNAQL